MINITKNETYRLLNFLHGEKPEQLGEVFRIYKDSQNNCTQRILLVMERVVAYDEASWPDDEYWENTLPDWLLSTFRNYSKVELEAILRDKSSWSLIAWSLGSWVDSMRDRAWVWWSIKDSEDVLEIILQVDGYPVSTSALEHLIEASGGKIAVDE